MASGQKLLERTREKLPGERVQAVVTGQTGIRPTWRFLDEWLVVLNRPRIIAVTDNAIVVFKAGQFRWGRTHPKQELYRVPRSTKLGPFKHGWTKVDLGQERIWVHRRAYPLLERADQTAGVAAGS